MIESSIFNLLISNYLNQLEIQYPEFMMTNQQQDTLEYWKKKVTERGFEIDLLEEHIENQLQDCISPESKLILYLALCEKTPDRIWSDYMAIFNRNISTLKTFKESHPVRELKKIIRDFYNSKPNIKDTDRIERLPLEKCSKIIEELGYRQGEKAEIHRLSREKMDYIINKKNKMMGQSPNPNEMEILWKILQEFKDDERS